MRLAVVMVSMVALAGTALAERRRADLGTSCPMAAARVKTVLGATQKAETTIAKRCEKDRWTQQSRACFSLAASENEARACVDKLPKDQRNALEGDADRLNEARLSRWLLPAIARSAFANLRPALPPNVNPNITLAVFNDAPDVRSARLLQKQGVSAYQAGRYEFAVRKLSAAIDVDPTPELVYHLAQAYRLNGDRAKALEQYEHYLEISPEGAAASTCRAQIEKLRDDVP